MSILTQHFTSPKLKTAHDEQWMRQALQQAERAADLGEVPVGAVLVHQDKLISEAYNKPISLLDPCAHAEVLALRQAAKQLDNYRLPGTTLYVTLEPCAMCVGAMVHARIERLVIGADDPKTGACGSVIDLLNHAIFNHKINMTRGILAENCGKVLKDFFKKRR